jgi:hypothetical protein
MLHNEKLPVDNPKLFPGSVSIPKFTHAAHKFYFNYPFNFNLTMFIDHTRPRRGGDVCRLYMGQLPTI